MRKIFVKSFLLTWVWFIQSVLAVPRQCDTKTIGGQDVLENCSGSTEKKCSIVYDSSGGRFVGRCVEGGFGPSCSSDRDCQVRKCFRGPGNAWRCAETGGYGRPCLTNGDCEEKYCDTRIQDGTLVSRCVPNGNTLQPCTDDNECQEKRCDTFYPMGSGIGHPICIRGGRGGKCVNSDECKLYGTRCEYTLDERGKLRGLCVHKGSSGRDCRNDRDCNPPELRCNGYGKCVFAGSGVPCERNEECAGKYCSADERCVTAGDPLATPYQCSKDEDCKGLKSRRCMEERNKDGSVVYKCSPDGNGEVCREDADCENLPKRCVKSQDGSFKCMKGAPSSAPLCRDDQECKKYEKICAPGGICQETQSPMHFDYPCRTNNECRYRLCVDGKCLQTRHGINISECRIDADCQVTHLECIRSRCERVFGAGPNQCLVDDDCTHNFCLLDRCVRAIGQGENECFTDADCQNSKPIQTPIPEMTQVQAPVVSQNLSDSVSLELEKASLKFDLSNEEIRVIKTILKNMSGYSLFDSSKSKFTILTFNDVDCGMSRRLIATLIDKRRLDSEVILVPVTLGGSKDNEWLNLRSYACMYHTMNHELVPEIVKRLFSKDTPGKTFHDRVLNVIWDDKKSLKEYVECFANNGQIKKWAGKLVGEIEKLRIDGTPTTYIIDIHNKRVFDYSGFREDFWENLPVIN